MSPVDLVPAGAGKVGSGVLGGFWFWVEAAAGGSAGIQGGKPGGVDVHGSAAGESESQADVGGEPDGGAAVAGFDGFLLGEHEGLVLAELVVDVALGDSDWMGWGWTLGLLWPREYFPKINVVVAVET